MPPSSARKPNIVLVFPDQIRRCATRFGGDPNVTTPVMDELISNTRPMNSSFRFILSTGLMFLGLGIGLLSGQGEGSENHRLIVLADMGNEPDEEQQMIHLLMYANEIDVEGLIAVTGYHLRESTHAEIFHKLIGGYGQVVENLRRHDGDWPTPDYLRSIVASGQPGYGMQAVVEGNASPGSALIIHAVERDDPRPIWIVVNAGSNTLAQALIDYRGTHSEAEMRAFVSKLRVFENGSQDNAGAWICANFPNIHWLRSNSQTYCYGGPGWSDRTFIGPYVWEPYENTELGQNFWMIKHIKAEHGPLGAMYPLRQFPDGSLRHLEGGGTIPWMGLVNKGLYDIDHPHWGGWSGRFTQEKVTNMWSGYETVRVDEEKVAPFSLHGEAVDTWVNPDTGEELNSKHAAVWRWRRSMFNDFKARMDWSESGYESANHNPVAVLNGDSSDTIVFESATVGQVIEWDASASFDPDQDAVDIDWWVYQEDGTFSGDVAIEILDSAQGRRACIQIPEQTAGLQFHVILEVTDRNPIATLSDYRRIVVDVLE